MTDEQVNSWIKYIGGFGLTSAAVSLALKAIKENRETVEAKKLEQKLDNYFSPEQKVEISNKELEAASKNVDKNKRALLLKKTASDDDIIPSNKALNDALKWLFALGAVAGSTWGTGKLYSLYKRNELQEDEAKAKKHYLNKIYVSQKLDDLEKEQKAPMYRYASAEQMTKHAGLIDTVFAGLYTVLGASAIAALLAGKHYMGKKFPKVEHKGLDNDLAGELTASDRIARKLKFVETGDKDSDTDTELIDAFEKTASIFEPDINAAILKIAADMESESGDFHGINDVINCVALGQAENIKSRDTVSDMIHSAEDFMRNTTKVASEDKIACARMYIGMDPILSEVIVPNAIIEIENRVPAMVKQASCVSPKDALHALITLISVQAEDMSNAMEKVASEIKGNTVEEDTFLDSMDRLIEHEIIGNYLTTN